LCRRKSSYRDNKCLGEIFPIIPQTIPEAWRKEQSKSKLGCEYSLQEKIVRKEEKG
jgi:hypothetical protein